MPANIDVMNGYTGRCPLLDDLNNDVTSSPEWQSHLQSQEALHDQLDAICDTQGLTDWAISYDHFFDAFRSRTCNSFNLPCNYEDPHLCVTSAQANQVYDNGNWEYAYSYVNYENAALKNRLTIGPFVSLLSDRIKGKMGNDYSTDGFYMYSGHDGTVAALLGALGFTGWKWPPYTSSLVFELWEDPSANLYYLRFFYNGELLSFPFCGSGNDELCEATEWLRWVTDKLISSDIVSECQVNSTTVLKKREEEILVTPFMLLI